MGLEDISHQNQFCYLLKVLANYTPYYQYSLYIWVSMLYLPFVQYLLGYNLGHGGRAGGVIHGSMMGLAMLLTLAFPLALIAAYDKAFPSYLRENQLYSLYLVC